MPQQTPKTRAATGADASAVMRDFAQFGSHLFDQPVDAQAAATLLTAIHQDRKFDQGLFLDEADFLANPQYVGVNPRSGRNLLDRFEGQLDFIEHAAPITAALAELLGADYQILDRKIVCGLPQSVLPRWVRTLVEGNPVNILGAYVKPQYRDITYFYGIDFHQDLIDFKDRDADFLTLYCYLHPVTMQDAPLYLLDGSHNLGATVFPHDLTPAGPETWLYGDRRGGQVQVGQRILTGQTGFAAIWHACTLHGTQPDVADHERISLRYLLARRPGTPAGIDQINAALAGPLRLTGTRRDIAESGAPVIKGNIVNGA